MADVTEPAELRFLKLWGLLKESVKVLLSHTKLFLVLTLTRTLPLCVVGLVYSLLTVPILARIDMDQLQLAIGHPSASTEQRLDQDMRRELHNLSLVLIVYYFSLAAYSLPCTSAMVYSVACIYSTKETSYKTVLSPVPRVWLRLIVTCLWFSLITFCYIIVCVLLTLFAAVLIYVMSDANRIVVYLVLSGGGIALLGGVTYLSCVYHLASIVTVLEESCGIGAMKKSLKLIKGKQLPAIGLICLYSLVTILIGWGFEIWVGSFHMVESVGVRVVLGCVLILFLSFVVLMGFLVQIVFYFACKAHHDESVDKLQLPEHVCAYFGEYVPLPSSIQAYFDV